MKPYDPERDTLPDRANALLILYPALLLALCGVYLLAWLPIQARIWPPEPEQRRWLVETAQGDRFLIAADDVYGEPLRWYGLDKGIGKRLDETRALPENGLVLECVRDDDHGRAYRLRAPGQWDMGAYSVDGGLSFHRANDGRCPEALRRALREAEAPENGRYVIDWNAPAYLPASAWDAMGVRLPKIPQMLTDRPREALVGHFAAQPPAPKTRRALDKLDWSAYRPRR